MLEKLKAYLKQKNLRLDVIAAGLAILIVLLFFSVKCQAGPYLDIGFGEKLNDQNNVFCTDPGRQDTYGVVALGYQLDESFRIQYKHNSCIDSDSVEGVLDSVEIIFRFEPKW